MIIQIRSPVFLPDDYHIFRGTLFFVGVALYAIYFDCKQQDRRALALAALLAVFCSLFIFAKQHIGVLLSFGVLIALIRDAVTRNADWKVPALFAVTFTASIPLFAFLLGITVDQLFGISFGNDIEIVEVFTNCHENYTNGGTTYPSFKKGSLLFVLVPDCCPSMHLSVTLTLSSTSTFMIVALPIGNTFIAISQIYNSSLRCGHPERYCRYSSSTHKIFSQGSYTYLND